jgi:phospholipid-binding lipoprotein MlaA
MSVNNYGILPAIAVFYLFLFIGGCATTTTLKVPPESPAMHSANEFSDDEKVIHVEDQWESFNRRMYKFNYQFDKHILLPVVSGYEFITPRFVQNGVSNFFGNIWEVRTFYTVSYKQLTLPTTERV